MRDILEKLIYAFGPSGFENPVRETIREMVAPYVDEITQDAIGNLICLKKGAGKRVMLAAHMDQIGIIATEADKHGFVRVHNLGYLYKNHTIGRVVEFENGVTGVLEAEVRDVREPDNAIAKTYVDIGAKTREEALSLVPIGTPGRVRPTVCDLRNRLVAGTAMDNRAGCALAIGALQNIAGCPNEVVAVFTAQEEVGLRGAKAAAYTVDPEIGIALDVTPTGDVVKGADKSAIKVGEGIAVKIMDSSVICTPSLVRALADTAEKAEIPYQREVLTHGGTDAGAIQTTRAGIVSGVLSVPCRYVHSAAEVISLDDLEGGARLLSAYLMRGDL